MADEDELHRPIDDILDGKVNAERAVAQDDAAEAEPDKPAKGRKAAKEPEPEPAPAADTDGPDDDDGEDDEPVVKANGKDELSPAEVKGIITERKKRQAAERELEQARAELARLNGPPAPVVPRQRPDPQTDPEGARQYDADQADDAAWRREAARSTAIMMEIKPDYREKEDAFIEAMRVADPVAREMMRVALRSAPDPALHAYNEGRRILREKEIGDDPSTYKERILAEEREKLKAEIMAELGVEARPKPKAPPSLATTQSVAPRDSGKTWDGPPPLSTLLPGAAA